MKKNKGFTLIELLAIIVILAIIAVITVPIILNIIENSRVGAAQDSAYGYKEAVEKYYVAQLYDNKEIRLEGNYNIENGVLTGNSLPEEGVLIPIDGTIPTSGYLKYEDNKLKEGCIVVGEYASTFTESKITKVEKGTTCSAGEPTPVITAGPIEEKCEYNRLVNGAYYTTGKCVKDNPVYYNPNTASECTLEEYTTNNPTPTTGAYKKDGCMKWFVYSKNSNGTLNLLLDHNTTPVILWVNSQDYSLENNVGVGYPEGYTLKNYTDNESGPITLLKQLKQDTESWSNNLIRNDSYTVSNLYYDFEVEISTNYTINYNTYKAKIISLEEINGIVASDYNNFKDINYFWMSEYVTDCDYDVSNCTSNISKANSSNETYGYWTSSPEEGGHSHFQFAIIFEGQKRNQAYVDSNYSTGIRPVITVPIKTSN